MFKANFKILLLLYLHQSEVVPLNLNILFVRARLHTHTHSSNLVLKLVALLFFTFFFSFSFHLLYTSFLSNLFSFPNITHSLSYPSRDTYNKCNHCQVHTPCFFKTIPSHSKVFHLSRQKWLLHAIHKHQTAARLQLYLNSSCFSTKVYS